MPHYIQPGIKILKASAGEGGGGIGVSCFYRLNLELETLLKHVKKFYYQTFDASPLTIIRVKSDDLWE